MPKTKRPAVQEQRSNNIFYTTKGKGSIYLAALQSRGRGRKRIDLRSGIRIGVDQRTLKKRAPGYISSSGLYKGYKGTAAELYAGTIASRGTGKPYSYSKKKQKSRK